MNETVEKALNDQINLELSSAYTYLSMAAHFDSGHFPGMASWMRTQWQEELAHAFKLYDYVNDRGGRVVLQAIPQPKSEFGTPLETFKEVLAHEKKVTASIHALHELAQTKGDVATVSHLNWFVDEQVEEEKTACDILDQLELIGDYKGGLFLLDSKLGERTAGGEE
jgi:ferritin